MSAPVLLPAATRVAVPWKDGGGITYEIAAGPEGAGFATFDWRLSMAEVAAAGPFSRFDGIDRSLAVLEGELALAVAGQDHRIGPGDAPVRFAGEAAATGTPLGGTVIDLNLMVRRGRASGRLVVLTPATVPDPAASVLFLVFTAPDVVDHDGACIAVKRFDAIRVDPAAWPATTMATQRPVLLAEISNAA